MRGFVRFAVLAAVIVSGLALAACNPQRAPGSQAPAAAAPPSAPSVLPPAGAIALKPGQMIQWGGTQKTYTVDGWTVTMSPAFPHKGEMHPVITVVDDQGRTISATGESGMTVSDVKIGAGKIDQSGDGDQLMMTSYSGGAHCCTRVQVLDRVNGKWTLLDLGMHDGDNVDFPQAQVPGGPPAFLIPDERFAYVFTDYADSAMPPRIFEIRGGREIDTSQALVYAPLFQKDMARNETACMKHDSTNGACAAFAADGARLGLRAKVWPVMLANYDQSYQWDLPTACRVKAAGECPKTQQVTLDFPSALEMFLVDAGYIPASDTQFPTSVPKWPTFPCAKVTSANLRLVCATPDLAVADHNVAFAYAHAMANSSNPEGLRADQEAFDKQVINAPNLGAIRNLYARRLAQLLGM